MKFCYFRNKLSALIYVAGLASILNTPAAEAFAATNNRDTISRTRQVTSTMRFSSKESEGQGAKAEVKKEEIERVTWNPLRLMVLKLGFTEPRFTSPLNYVKKDGVFSCAYCGHELFESSGKYDSGSGWPSFWRSIKDGSIGYKKEWDGRLECTCGRCDSHLGHVFLDGPLPGKVDKTLLETAPSSDPRGRKVDGYLPRFCVNGASLTFETKEDGSKD